MKPNLEKLKQVYGDVLTLTTPSGHEVIIRQQTGEDDDVLSNAAGTEDGSSSNKFVQGIVVHTNMTTNGKFNSDDARALKLCDKYFIMIASRIFSIGQILKFEYKWDDLKIPTSYEEDLGLFIWEYGNADKPFPELGSPEYFKYRIAPHKFGKDKFRELTLASEKLVRYTFMNGNGEKYLMGLPLDQQSVNAELKARGLELKIGKKWVIVQSFKNFTPIDMMEIRRDVEDNDITTNLASELEHPKKGTKVEFPIVGSTDFFYPREI